MNPGSIIISLIFLLALFGGSSARAQDTSEEDELNQFLDLLDQQTTLATRTRLNADFVPGMLSVLNAEQLQRRGFRNVWEALASLPGVLVGHNRDIAWGVTTPYVDTELVNLIVNEIHDWLALAGEADTFVHLYGKREARDARKMGHLNRVLASRATT